MTTETALQTLRQPRLDNPSRVVTAFCVEADSHEHELAQMLQAEGVLKYKRTVRYSDNSLHVLYRLVEYSGSIDCSSGAYSTTITHDNRLMYRKPNF